MTRKDAIITGVVGLSALAMVAPAARAEDSKRSRSHITPSAQEEVDRAARFIHGPIQVDPLASDWILY